MPENTSRTATTPVDYRRRRNRCVVGLFVCVALANVINLFAPEMVPGADMSPITRAMLGFALLSGLVGIVLFVIACWAYARLRGYHGGIGIGGALAGMTAWLGITIYLMWPSIEAQVQGIPGPPWDNHAPLALWAGFAAGGLLLKALPERDGVRSATARGVGVERPKKA